MNIKRPRGTNDIFGTEVLLWQDLENKLRLACTKFGIQEIRTPIFEYTEIFERGIGETTDVVQKEMFTFMDRGERNYCLKPEGTAGAARAFIENGLYSAPLPAKLYYIAPSFRDERNQAGRYKQFHQFGVEAFGSYDSSCDAEVISFVYYILEELKLKNVELHINSLGGNECRRKYNVALKSFIEQKLDLLCEDCRERFAKNPLRVLDCKNEKCRRALEGAPNIIENLGTECRAHFESLQRQLDNMGVKYIVDSKIVRGLDYYTRTVFEFICKSDKLGSQSTICGGGRYDNLISECGGPQTGAVGFAIGMERLLMILKEQGLAEESRCGADIYIGSMGEAGFLKAQSIGYQLRRIGISAEYDIMKRSVKAQLKYADKTNASYVVILGDNELSNGFADMKSMFGGESQRIDLSRAVEQIADIIGIKEA